MSMNSLLWYHKPTASGERFERTTGSKDKPCSAKTANTKTAVFLPFKGGNPAAGSPTATLLRLHPSRRH